MFKSYGAIVLALLMAACGAPKPKETTPPGTIAPAVPPPIAGSVYRIDPAQSELRILVYRSGPMAPLGHNHVIDNRALGGSVVYGGAGSTAAFALNVPTDGFVVDDARLRREEGADFAEDIPDDSKSGTLHNMLSASLLAAARFPVITARGEITPGRLETTVTINVAGHESTLIVPFTADISPARLTASGDLNLRQSALGLTPFSVFLGALKVQDEMRVRFRLVAVAN